MWQDDLLTRLRGASTSAGSRIAWYERQRNWKSQTSAVLSLDNDGRNYSHDGPVGLDDPQLTIDLFAKGGEEVETLAGEVRAVLETADVTIGGTRFGMGFVRAGRTVGPEDFPDGERLMRRRLLVRISVEDA